MEIIYNMLSQYIIILRTAINIPWHEINIIKISIIKIIQLGIV